MGHNLEEENGELPPISCRSHPQCRTVWARWFGEDVTGGGAPLRHQGHDAPGSGRGRQHGHRLRPGRDQARVSRSVRRWPRWSGGTPRSTSSTRPATPTSLATSSPRCAWPTRPSSSSTPQPGSRLAPSRCGGLPKNGVSRACSSSTRWTARTPTSGGRSPRPGPRSAKRWRRSNSPSAPRSSSVESSISSPNKRIATPTTTSGEFSSGPIPDELKEDEELYRRQLVESIAEQDEELMMRYLEDEPIAMDELTSGLKQCVADGVVVPVLVGSAALNRGVRAAPRCHRRHVAVGGRGANDGNIEWQRGGGSARGWWPDRGPRLQDDGRSSRGTRHVSARLFWIDQVKHPRLECDARRG